MGRSTGVGAAYRTVKNLPEDTKQTKLFGRLPLVYAKQLSRATAASVRVSGQPYFIFLDRGSPCACLPASPAISTPRPKFPSVFITRDLLTNCSPCTIKTLSLYSYTSRATRVCAYSPGFPNLVFTNRFWGLQSNHSSIRIPLQLHLSWPPCLDQTYPQLTSSTKFTNPPTHHRNASSVSNHYLNTVNHGLPAHQEALISSGGLQGLNRAVGPQSSPSRRVQVPQHGLPNAQHHCTPVIGLTIKASRAQIPLLRLHKAFSPLTGPREPPRSRNIRQTQYATLLKLSARIPKVRIP